MAKIQLKSDNITPFGGLYSIFNQFNRSGVRKTVDSFLGSRSCDPKAFSYGDVFASLFASYLCGGECIEDVMDVKSFWNGHDGIRIASSDTIERTLRKLSCDNITYENTDKVSYAFNTADRLNSLLLKLLKVTGQLNPGDCIDLDFDHQFIQAGKKDAKYSYKKADGYFPGVATVGGLIVGIENRDANTHVKFHQVDTLWRIIGRLEDESRVVIRNFRADCGSYSEAIVDYVKDHCEHFYLRTSSCRSRHTEFMEHKDWEEVRIGGLTVVSLPSASTASFLMRTSALSSSGRKSVTRTPMPSLRAYSERNTFIAAYSPMAGATPRRTSFSTTISEVRQSATKNTVFLLVTAMLKNFYLYILQVIGSAVKGLDITNRLKRFIHRFVCAPAKWIRSGRQEVLNIYSRQLVYLVL